MSIQRNLEKFGVIQSSGHSIMSLTEEEELKADQTPAKKDLLVS